MWRAMHVRVDPPPHVLEDEIGLQLVASGKAGSNVRTWTSAYRAGIVARARFIENLGEASLASCSTSSSALAWTPSPS